MSTRILLNYLRCTMEYILTECITGCYGNCRAPVCGEHIPILGLDLLPSGRKCRNFKARTYRFKSSFFPHGCQIQESLNSLLLLLTLLHPVIPFLHCFVVLQFALTSLHHSAVFCIHCCIYCVLIEFMVYSISSLQTENSIATLCMGQ